MPILSPPEQVSVRHIAKYLVRPFDDLIAAVRGLSHSETTQRYATSYCYRSFFRIEVRANVPIAQRPRQ